MMSRRILAVGLVLAAMAPVLAQDRSEPLQLSLFSLKATAAYPLRQDSNQWLGSNLIGANVVSVTNERIGKIVNLILNDDGKVEAARDDLLRATSFKSLRQQLAEVQEKR